MTIKLGDKQIRIRWQHSFIDKIKFDMVPRNEAGELQTDEKGNLIVITETITTPKKKSERWTKCFITLGEGKDAPIIAEAKAICHPNDVYSKCKGRMESLTTALKMLYQGPVQDHIILTKEDRRAIWTKYAEMTKCDFQVGEKKRRKVEHQVVQVVN